MILRDSLQRRLFSGEGRRAFFPRRKRGTRLAVILIICVARSLASLSLSYTKRPRGRKKFFFRPCLRKYRYFCSSRREKGRGGERVLQLKSHGKLLVTSSIIVKVQMFLPPHYEKQLCFIFSPRVSESLLFAAIWKMELFFRVP